MASSSSSSSAREPRLSSPENMSFLHRIFPSSLLPASPSRGSQKQTDKKDEEAVVEVLKSKKPVVVSFVTNISTNNLAFPKMNCGICSSGS